MPLRSGRWIAWILAGAAALVLVGGAALAWLSQDLPDPRPLRDPAWVAKRFDLSEWTPLATVAPGALRAILLSEDDTYFQHHGLRLDELGSAFWDDLSTLRYKRGASSITQQVVKNAFLGKEKTLSRKLRELLLARRADRVVGKRPVLEAYLNLAEWGPQGQRGIAFAARRYLGKAPDKLTASEGALLAWLLPDPRSRGRCLRRGELPSAARHHIRHLLEALVREDALTQDQADAMRVLPFPFERRAAPVVLPPPQGAAP